MQFLKAHYEKIILSIVLLGLAAAAALMPMKVAQERDREEERKRGITNPKVNPLQPANLTNDVMVLARLDHPERLKLAGEHNVFNPVRWQKTPDGGIIKQENAGINALEVTEITPLRLEVKFEDVIPGQVTRYRVSVLNELQRSSSRPTPRDAAPKEKNNMFTIENVVGDADNPKELEVVLAGDKNPITISREKPYERVIGYSADFRYPVENNKQWKNLKVKDELTFGGETYNIVAITQDQVVLSAKSNKKQTIIDYKPPRK